MGSLKRAKLVAIVPVKGMADLYSLHLSYGMDNHFLYVSYNHIRARGLCIGDTVEFETNKRDTLRPIIEERTGDEKVWEDERASGWR